MNIIYFRFTEFSVKDLTENFPVKTIRLKYQNLIS